MGVGAELDKKLLALVRSRRVWVAISGVAVVVAEQLGLPLSEDAVNQIVMVMAAWIVGDSLTKTE